MIKIYKLIHNGQIVYIGQTKQKLTRRKDGGYYKNEKLHKISKECKIELIEETDDVSRERYWIDKLKGEGHNLLNKYYGNGLDNKEYQKKYQKGYQKEYQKEYYEKNKEVINQKRKEYQKEYRKRKKMKNII
jgi:hypothetical protein